MSDDVFRWVIAVAVLLACVASVCQALILAALYRAGKEAQKAAQKAGKEVQTKVAPLVDRFDGLFTTFSNLVTASTKLVEENRPRIAEITSEALVITKAARVHADHIGQLIEIPAAAPRPVSRRSIRR